MLSLQPITYREACAFVDALHRHHEAPQGWLFGVAANDGEKVVAVAISGRPVSRHLDDGWTVEVTRMCSDGARNACGFLYTACRNIAFATGYRRAITYTLAEEEGVSLRAVQWLEHQEDRGGGSWSRKDRKRTDKAPTGPKRLWLAPGSVPLGERLPPRPKVSIPTLGEISQLALDWPA